MSTHSINNFLARKRSESVDSSTCSSYLEGVFGTAMENVVVNENAEGDELEDSGDRDTADLSMLSGDSLVCDVKGDISLHRSRPTSKKKPLKSISTGSSIGRAPGSCFENFHSKLVTKQMRHMLYEICCDGQATLLEMSSRELCSYVNECGDVRVQEGVAVVDTGAEAIGEALESRSPAVNPMSRHSQSVSSRGKLLDLSGNTSKLSPPPKNQIGIGTSQNSINKSSVYKGSLKLHHRDLRLLLTENHSSEPFVAVRYGVVLIHMESIKAIVLKDRIFLVVDDGADSILSEVERKLAVISLYQRSPDFELRAYETLMDIATSHLVAEVKSLEPKVRAIVNLMESESRAATSAESNSQFRNVMNIVNEVLLRTRARQRAISSVLDEASDLAFMYLTKMSETSEVYTLPLNQNILGKDDEVEILFENFLQDANSLVNVLEITKDRMRNTEALVSVKLDIARNRLLTADTIFGMIAMCSSFGALFSGIMGMNLEEGWDFTNWAFFLTVIFIIGFSVVIGSCVFIRMQRDGIWVR